jgi:HEAT repeat protein
MDELFQRTLAGNYDDDEPWESVRELQTAGGREVFEKAVMWCRSDEPLRRARGADVLGQLGKTAENPTTSFAQESFSVLAAIVAEELDPRVLGSTIAALGHLENPDALPFILPFAEHPDANVRFSLVFALGCFADDGRSIPALVKLMSDVDGHVRDWATFGLGSLSTTDNPEIREALFRNLHDNHRDVREEAIAGLARRGDKRCLPPLIEALQDSSSLYVMDAARDLLGEPETGQEVDSTALVDALHRRFPEEFQK